MEIKDVDPAKYPPKDPAERAAISALIYLLDPVLIKPNIQVSTTTPNYDGFIELTKENQTPIGKLDVQVKKLPDEHSDNPQFQCKLPFLSYCYNNNVPVLLIVVDTQHDVAYWQWMNRKLIDSLKIDDGQESKSIKLPKENFIRKGDRTYYAKWQEIIEIGIKLQDEVEKYRKNYELLLKNSDPTIGIEDTKFIELHKFLDYLNSKLDREFLIVKQIFFPNCWKLGIAYWRYQPTHLAYSFYSIPQNKNDVQIRYLVGDALQRFFKETTRSWSENFVENPIQGNPKEYALKFIHDKIKEIIEHKALACGNEILAREVLFYFIATYHNMLGVKIQEKYSVSEIDQAFNKYLPLWLDEANHEEVVKNMKKALRAIHPDILLAQLNAQKYEEIDKKVRARIEGGSKADLNIMGMELEFFYLAFNALSYLRANNIGEIEQVFVPRNIDRVKGKPVTFVWSFWSIQDVKTNLRIFFDKIVKIYDQFVIFNFPYLEKELKFFSHFDRVIILVGNLKDSYQNINEEPVIMFYYLKSIHGHESRMDIYWEGDENFTKFKDLEYEKVTLDGNEYELLGRRWTRLRFIYQGFPITFFIYELLAEKLDRYFRYEYKPA